MNVIAAFFYGRNISTLQLRELGYNNRVFKSVAFKYYI